MCVDIAFLAGTLVLLLFAVPFIMNRYTENQDVVCPHCTRTFHVRESVGWKRD